MNMKCKKCVRLNKDKSSEPCSLCIHRPHELCCFDRFIPIEENPIKQEVNMKYKLQIQYPVKKEHITLAFHLGRLEGLIGSVNEIDNSVIEFATGDKKGREGIPESWLIPIEDEVITAEEYLDRRMESQQKAIQVPIDVYKADIRAAFKAGEKNQWINHAELIDVVNEFIDKTEGANLTSQVVNDWVRVFKRHSENIKPLT